MISSAVMPQARQSRITLAGTRVPAITACPCVTRGSLEISSICSAVTGDGRNTSSSLTPAVSKANQISGEGGFNWWLQRFSEVGGRCDVGWA